MKVKGFSMCFVSTPFLERFKGFHETGLRCFDHRDNIRLKA